MTAALITAGVLGLLAGLLHCYIFILESYHWTDESTLRTFSIPSRQEAEQTKEMAFNQGYYNLALGIMAIVGAILVFVGQHTVGVTLLTAGTGAMALAACVLFLSSPDKRSAALKQGAFPILTLIALCVAWILA